MESPVEPLRNQQLKFRDWPPLQPLKSFHCHRPPETQAVANKVGSRILDQVIQSFEAGSHISNQS